MRPIDITEQLLFNTIRIETNLGTQQILIKSNMKTALIPLVENLGINKNIFHKTCSTITNQ